jgi:type III restriction enzyme
LQGLSAVDPSLLPYGPGRGSMVTLDEWRGRTRVQQVAFSLARAVTAQWVKDNGVRIPVHRLFALFLGYAERYLREKVKTSGSGKPQDAAINPYFERAVAALAENIKPLDASGARNELPVIPSGRAGTRSTAAVDFRTGRALHPCKKSHLNAYVADTSRWEQAAAFALDSHAAVEAWVKNDHLGFVVPYRRDGGPRKYLPDFIVRLVSGRYLIVEIKGRDLGDVEIKTSAARRWVDAVNRDGRYGQWEYHLLRDPSELRVLLDRAMAAA